MGLGGISFGSLLLIFLIILLLFGTKRLKDIGEDLGQAVRNFRRGLQEPEAQKVAELDSKKSENS